MFRYLPALFSLSVLAAACATDPDELATETLLVPASVELHWSEAFNGEDDGLGAVVPVDVMVYDSLSGEPRSGVEIELRTPSGAFALREGDLVRVDPESCATCELFWDAWRDQYFVLLGDPLDDGVTRLRTDDEGLARAFVMVDSFDHAPGGFVPAQVRVSSASSNAVIVLLPR